MASFYRTITVTLNLAYQPNRPSLCCKSLDSDSASVSLLTILLLQYSTEGKIKEPNLAAEAGQGLMSAVSSYARGDMGGVFSSVSGLFKVATGNQKSAEAQSRRTKTSPADVVSISSKYDITNKLLNVFRSP